MAKLATNSTSFWDQSVSKIEEALSIRKQIESLQNKLSALVSGTPSESVATAPKRRGRKAGSKVSAPAAPSAPAKARTSASGKKKTGLTPEGRAKLAASMKARWAARKAAANN